ncbi:MAG: tetraacyldisaccharide 4'-kinase, partial [Candidatus Omnitrophota bacterium]
KKFFKTKKVPLVVISVGNLTMGGTGKTPFVKWLARVLLSRGKKPVVLLRGYKNLSQDLSDEALELREALPEIPVWVGKNRASLAEKAFSDGKDAVVLDDGFQYRGLERDLDIVLVDATNPFGNGKVLPRGILREPLAGLRRADVLILTRADGDPERWKDLVRLLRAYAPETPILHSEHRVQLFFEARTRKDVPLALLQKEICISFCGIGNPSAFQRLLEGCLSPNARTVVFMDHHRYRRKDLEQLDRIAKETGAAYLVTTEKDLERLQQLHLWPVTRLVVMKVEFVVTQYENELLRRLDSLFSR